MTIRGKLPELDRADKILDDAEKYFAEARERHRRDILNEQTARRKAKRNARLA